MRCPKCKIENNRNNKYCSNCGFTFSSKETYKMVVGGIGIGFSVAVIGIL